MFIAGDTINSLCVSFSCPDILLNEHKEITDMLNFSNWTTGQKLRLHRRGAIASGGSRIFPGGGPPTPKSAIIFQFFAENCMKMKEFGPPGWGARPWRPPLDPPMIALMPVTLIGHQ